MREFNYVIHDGSICVLISINDKTATIDGIMSNIHNDSLCIYEIDVPINSIGQCTIEVSDKSMISRLRDYRLKGNDIFGFVEEELSLIHSFT